MVHSVPVALGHAELAVEQGFDHRPIMLIVIQ